LPGVLPAAGAFEVVRLVSENGLWVVCSKQQDRMPAGSLDSGLRGGHG